MVYYLVGIKGAAMSALAKILLEEGHIVKGVDYETEFYTLNSEAFNIDNFNTAKLNRTYFYIIGNAFVSHNLTKEIIKQGFKYMYYPDFLNFYFEKYKWICVAGTHGKTTTTKFLCTILDDSMGLIGNGEYNYGNNNFILESCEYRDTFLKYRPDISLVLNVDYDHIDYFVNEESYITSFVKFIQNSKICVLNGDEFNYRADNVITFGKNINNDVVFKYDNGRVTILNKIFFLPIKGEKIAYDFVGAYIVSKLLNIRDNVIQNKLNNFVMPKRRYQKKVLDNKNVILDYAHHPNEIKALFEMTKEEYPNSNIACVFEPHTFSRLNYFKKDFKSSLELFDKCYLSELYNSVRENARETDIEKLYNELGFEKYSIDINWDKYDVICFLGAGRIDEKYDEYVKKLLK